MIVYLAGKITGDPAYRAKFADAEMVLRELGHTVLNPAMLPDGLEYAAYLLIDEQLLRAADAVCLLPDWRKSAGARQEHELARRLGKMIIRYDRIDVTLTEQKES